MTKESPAIAAFKLWVFPSLVSLLGLMIWNDVNEIKSDVKLLMAQSNIDKTRIDNLERQLYKNASVPVAPRAELPDFVQLVAIRPDEYILPKKTKSRSYDF